MTASAAWWCGVSTSQGSPRGRATKRADPTRSYHDAALFQLAFEPTGSEQLRRPGSRTSYRRYVLRTGPGLTGPPAQALASDPPRCRSKSAGNTIVRRVHRCAAWMHRSSFDELVAQFVTQLGAYDLTISVLAHESACEPLIATSRQRRRARCLEVSKGRRSVRRARDPSATREAHRADRSRPARVDRSSCRRGEFSNELMVGSTRENPSPEVDASSERRRRERAADATRTLYDLIRGVFSSDGNRARQLPSGERPLIPAPTITTEARTT